MEKKRKIGTYTFIFGFLLIMLLLIIIFIYSGYEKYTASNLEYVSEDLDRNSTIDGFASPQEVVEYLSCAIQEGDEDKFLRGCAIDEITHNLNIAWLINYKGKFTIADIPASASTYQLYSSITACEISNFFSQTYESILFSLSNKRYQVSRLILKEINYIYPEKQMEESFKAEVQEISGIYGAESLCEIYAIYQLENEEYIAPFTLIKYNGYWKLFSMDSELSELGKEKMIEYFDGSQSYKGDEESIDQLNNYLAISEDGTLNNEDVDDSLLPANYFLISPQYGKSPEEIVERFTFFVQKGDFISAMSYGSKLDDALEQEKSLSEIIEIQTDFFIQIKRGCYGLLGLPGDSTLEELGDMTSEQLVDQCNPQNIFYMDLTGIKKLKEEKDYCELLAVYRYQGNHYLLGFTFSKEEQGWRIENLSAEDGGLLYGNVRSVTITEVNALLQE